MLTWNIVKNGVVTESANQSQWNLDQCNGTGESGFSLDISATNIFTGQLEWLGAGVVLVGFVTPTGEAVYCHAFMHASIAGFTDVYMRTANLPVSYEITALSDNTGSMKAICNSVISGGGYNPLGILQTISPAPTTTSYAVLAGQVELIVGFILKSDEFEQTVLTDSFNGYVATENDDVRYSLCFNPTYAGSVTWVDLTNSSIQYAVNNNNAVISPGSA